MAILTFVLLSIVDELWQQCKFDLTLNIELYIYNQLLLSKCLTVLTVSKETILFIICSVFYSEVHLLVRLLFKHMCSVYVYQDDVLP